MGLTISEMVVVRTDFHGEVAADEIRHWLHRVEQLIVAARPFYFIAVTRPGASFCVDYRAIQGRWYKQYRSGFRTCCKGLVRLAGSEAERQRLDTPALHAAWGVPYFVTTDSADGMRWIGEQLEQADAH